MHAHPDLVVRLILRGILCSEAAESHSVISRRLTFFHDLRGDVFPTRPSASVFDDLKAVPSPHSAMESVSLYRIRTPAYTEDQGLIQA